MNGFSDGFMTDSQISAAKVNGEVPMKELEHWVPEGTEDTDLHDLHAGGEFCSTADLADQGPVLL